MASRTLRCSGSIRDFSIRFVYQDEHTGLSGIDRVCQTLLPGRGAIQSEARTHQTVGTLHGTREMWKACKHVAKPSHKSSQQGLRSKGARMFLCLFGLVFLLGGSATANIWSMDNFCKAQLWQCLMECPLFCVLSNLLSPRRASKLPIVTFFLRLSHKKPLGACALLVFAGDRVTVASLYM